MISIIKCVTKHKTPAGLIMEANCTQCAAGKYQTGAGLIAEINCTLCAAGKYQTGAGINSSLTVWQHQSTSITRNPIQILYTRNTIQVDRSGMYMCVPHTSTYQDIPVCPGMEK